MGNSITKRVKEIICEKLGLQPNRTNRKHSLKDDLGCDSLDAVDLIMELEKEFGVYIDDNDFEQMGASMWKVGDVQRYVVKLVNQKANEKK